MRSNLAYSSKLHLIQYTRYSICTSSRLIVYHLPIKVPIDLMHIGGKSVELKVCKTLVAYTVSNQS